MMPWEANVVWTRGTDNRLVLAEYRERAGMCQVAKKRVEVSWMRGVDSVNESVQTSLNLVRLQTGSQ